MIVNLIAAIDPEGGIGLNGGLPWHCPEDLRFFKNCTKGQNILMGRKTFESVGILPDRNTFVISSKPIAGVNWIKSMDDLDVDHIWMCGGVSIYNIDVPYDTIYITKMYDNYKCDTYCPKLLEISRTLKVHKFFECGKLMTL